MAARHDVTVKLFVSYARSDAAFVRALVSGLEAAGHDTWVDTDDLVGSEQWRASIVDGVRSSDAVLLVVSPRSMESNYVEREVVVAADQRRRILPIVAEPAALSGSIMFELAGSQQHSFVGRPFEEAMGELLEALGTLAPAATPAATQPVASRRNLMVIGIVAVLVAAVLAVQLTRGDDDTTTTASSPSTSPPASSSEVGSGPSAGSATTLSGEVWFAGFRFSAQRLSPPASGGRLVVALRATNDMFADADPGATIGDVALEWPDDRTPALCSCSTRVPPGATASVELEFAVPRDLDLRTATLVFGAPADHQARMPIGGSPSTERPVTEQVSGTVDDGDGTRFTAEQVRVVPARCDGLADRLGFRAGPRSEFAVVVVGSAVYRGKYPVNLGEATLTTPDGAAIASSSLDGSIYALYDNRPQRGIAVCFDVPGPVAGSYRLAVTRTGLDPSAIQPLTLVL